MPEAPWAGRPQALLIIKPFRGELLARPGLRSPFSELGARTSETCETRARPTASCTRPSTPGINFFDNAWEYHDGKSEEILGRALAGGKRDKVFLMTKVCTHGRKADVAMRISSRSRCGAWGPITSISGKSTSASTTTTPTFTSQPDGVIEALDKAKQQGKTRFVGFTGHKDPAFT
jgi:hypothetical protein